MNPSVPIRRCRVAKLPDAPEESDNDQTVPDVQFTVMDDVASTSEEAGSVTAPKFMGVALREHASKAVTLAWKVAVLVKARACPGKRQKATANNKKNRFTLRVPMFAVFTWEAYMCAPEKINRPEGLFPGDGPEIFLFPFFAVLRIIERGKT